MTAPLTRPTLAVGAVIFDEGGRVALVCRGKPPLAGTWTLPGGSVELAESVREATAREVLEETGLVVEVGPLVEVYEHVSRGTDESVTFHYVILDHLCWSTGGTLQAGSDAAAAAFVAAHDFDAYNVGTATRSVVARARTAWAVNLGPRPCV